VSRSFCTTGAVLWLTARRRLLVGQRAARAPLALERRTRIIVPDIYWDIYVQEHIREITNSTVARTLWPKMVNRIPPAPADAQLHDRKARNSC